MSSELSMLPPFETASVLVRALYDHGVRHVVVSPGSRSTPLTLALAHHHGFQKHVVLDERSAAFIALGIGKESGIPPVLVCTSGTAAANYLPAVVEAKQSGVPMVICTADRPPHRRGTGNSQTIDQIKLYGSHAVFFHEMGEPAGDERDRDRIQFAGRQAVSESIQLGGAAHLNLPFRKPLEPSKELLQKTSSVFEKQVLEQVSTRPGSVRSVSLTETVSELINRSKRPLIIAGPANCHHSNNRAALQLSEKISAPVIAEPGSRFDVHSHRIHRYEQFLRDDAIRTHLKPDLILRFGDQPFTKSLLTALDAWKQAEFIRFDARHSWQDAGMAAAHVIDLTPDDHFEMSDVQPKESGFLDKWLAVDSESGQALQAILENEPSLTDGHVFRHISDTIGPAWNMMLSNSLPPRDAALFGVPGKRVSVNRGAAGIDGIISTAIGLALSTGAPTCCVVGDLAFLHDSNALLSIRHLNTPFVIVVINNGGGNIFRMLPIYEHGETYLPYFETPQDVEIEHIAKAHNIRYKRVLEKENLHQFSFDEARTGKPLIIEYITNADAGMAMRQRLWKGA